jgi:hypothetical protein
MRPLVLAVANRPVDAPALTPLFTKLRHWRELYRDYGNEFLYTCMAYQWLPRSLSTKRADTVGQLPSTEIGVSNMPSLVVF